MKYPQRVMCIKPLDNPSECAKGRPAPEVGDEDMATGEIALYGEVYYTLARFGEQDGYHVDNFATLPDPSEEVAIEHEQEALIYQR